MPMLKSDSPLRALDAKRIVGNSFAIALHAIALAVLMMPSQAPDAKPMIDDEPITIVPEQKKEDPPKVEREITREEVKPEKIIPQASPVIAPPDHPNPVVDNRKPTDTPGDTTPVIDPPIDNGTGLPALPTGPIGVQLLNGPRPAYPPIAKRESMTGTVILLLTVGLDGRVLDARVQKSSGHRLLDQTALRHVERTWVFVPATLNGNPVIAEVVLPVEFSLGND
jgi:periplasmic protein TonB